MNQILGTTIRTGETGIVERLKAKAGNVQIEAFPDNPKAFRLTHQVGALLVAYQGSKYSAPMDAGEAVQERTMTFDIIVVSRSLTAHEGALDLLEAARLAVVGHRIQGFKSPIRIQRERFIGREEMLWNYAISLEMDTFSIPVDEEVAGPLLAHLTMESDYTTSEITDDGE